MAGAVATAAFAVSLGDPNGLGPDLVCTLWGSTPPTRPMVCIGPESALAERAQMLGIKRFWHHLDQWPEKPLAPGTYCLTPRALTRFRSRPGVATPEGGAAAGQSLAVACEAVRDGQAAALVTCPLNKAMLQAAGYDFPGHTEFLARFLGLQSDDVCMHLAGPRLRVSLVTTHPPLRQVPELVTAVRVERCLRQTWALVCALDDTPAPLAVCGLNPHAGEGGAIGTEEETAIVPGIQAAAADGVGVIGPIPADTVFHRALQGEFSAVLAMYHDQGLGPLKTVHFGQAVNVTLGLPVVRTSVDHGTGYDKVGTGTASAESLALAVDMAARLVPTHRHLPA
ncbi:4-hydroxythreonine-4-phosphate dehydrogenase PdxA [Desulfohalobium retbaense]|uniref:4-hydroxythreonine-4-phosphate dehydrogenase n=1 Tax=Desulfohalobium retbaense (strain ATCC 49708 / DSM 5692 / JCM 16813 / HR100) TaxID=485915 RepID=C8X110_DESRD|nr:4-hydroxythreonine-4-phosphate dehydrogenase PdxA [Desulfohalobium retbaense]ACV68107.1 4-hydroxythreonine-4-phosphate dehydrogenase [Desulfohalobium retbaense DSM 5692]